VQRLLRRLLDGFRVDTSLRYTLNTPPRPVLGNPTNQSNPPASDCQPIQSNDLRWLSNPIQWPQIGLDWLVATLMIYCCSVGERSQSAHWYCCSSEQAVITYWRKEDMCTSSPQQSSNGNHTQVTFSQKERPRSQYISDVASMPQLCATLCWMAASSESFIKDSATSTSWSDGTISLC
jgi:hypothetical protein